MDATSCDETLHDRRRAGRSGPVLAAVDDSNLAVMVAGRAAEHARTSGRALVVVTVVPVADARGLREGGELLGDLDDCEDTRAIAWRVGPTLDALAVAYQLKIRGYLARGGPRRQARRIAATVLRVARHTGAEMIAVGQPRHQAPSGVSVSAWIAKGAPAHVLVLFAQQPPRATARVSREADSVLAADGDLAGVAGTGQPVGDPSGPERFLLVHPVEAPLDDTRISADSPLARALLGRRIGDEVEVRAPGGTYRCRILAAERSPSDRRRVT